LHTTLLSRPIATSGEQTIAIAGAAGVDGAALEACLAAGRGRAAVQQDIETARRVGVSATPAFFVNGIPFTGRRTLPGFAEAIDAELARKATAPRAE
jgi:protein-disulfide isomerase